MGSSHSIEAAVELISTWHLNAKERLIFDSGRMEVAQYLESIDNILQSGHRVELKDIISMAVARLKLEFQAILTRQIESILGSTSITELSSSMTDTTTSYQFRYEEYVLYELPNKEISDYLRNIAERMNSCGQLGACIDEYVSLRKHFVDSIIKRLKVDELLAGDTKRFLREELKMKTERWIQAAKVGIKKLFVNEKQMAKLIFGGIGMAVVEESFMRIVKVAVVNVFSFAEIVCASHQSSERIEVILILYNALSSLLPDVNALFQFESGKGVRNRVEVTLSGLQDEVRRMLSEFENAVLREVSTISDEMGTVHPLTKYVMEYLNLLVNHRKVMMSIVVSKPSMTLGSSEFLNGELQDIGNLSPFALHVVLVIAVLQMNLDVKSKYYKNASCGCLFMMNNIQFIIQKIKGSRDLQEVVGTEYLKKLAKNLKQAMASFQELTSDKLLHCLKEEDLHGSGCYCDRVSTSALRKRVKDFNSFCDDMHAVQSSLEIQDLSLREELRESIIEKLLPAYKSFLKKFRKHLKCGKSNRLSILSFRKITIKYSAEELEDMVLKSYKLCPSSSEAPSEKFRLRAG